MKTGMTSREKKRLKQAKRRLKSDFTAWKQRLKDLIDTQTTVEQESDGNIRYVLSPDLQKLVWSAAVYEQVKVTAQENAESPLSVDELAEEVSLALKVRFKELALKLLAPTSEINNGEKESGT